MRLTFECGVFPDRGVPLFRFQSRSVDAGGSSGDDAAGAGRSGERHAGASAALGMERGRVERHLRGGSTAALDPALRAFDTGRDAGGAAAFDRSVVAEEFSVADEAARAGGSEFDGATCRRAFQFDFGTTGGRDAFEGAVIASTAMCAVPLVSIAASLVCSGCSAVILAAPPAFNPVIPASGVSSENAAMPLASSRVMPAAGT